jgi:heme/copper-type cytochrome/quinol oxidase subunit 1
MVGDAFGRISAAGGIVLLLGALAVFLSVLASETRSTPTADADDDGLTLEWAAPSPPPPHNFDTLPEVRSDTPVADLEKASV